MNGCIDPKTGQLLHDYELRLLSEEDKHQFEMHLYGCDYCLAQVQDFVDASKILAGDPDAQALIEKIARESEAKKEKKKSSPLIKLLIAAILVVVIAVPVYRYSIYKKRSDVVQTLELLPTRTGGNDILYLEKGGDATISFYVAEGFEGSVHLVISKVDGGTVVSQKDFTNINDRGMGSITLPISDFSEGHYMLQVSPTDSIAVPERLYMFRVK